MKIILKTLTVIIVVVALFTVFFFSLSMESRQAWIGPLMRPMMTLMNPAPKDLNFATNRKTENGLFNVSFTSNPSPTPLNQIHTWTLHVETPDGKLVENAKISVDGGMPQHGHGLPTSPQVTQYLGSGNYRVEGMKFQMNGWWEVKFVINNGNSQDRVVFNLTL